MCQGRNPVILHFADYVKRVARAGASGHHQAGFRSVGIVDFDQLAATAGLRILLPPVSQRVTVRIRRAARVKAHLFARRHCHLKRI